MSSAWQYIHASVSGTSHIEKNIPCQDSHLCIEFDTDNEKILLLIAADGAGSAKFSDTGSAKACELLAEKIKAFLQDRNTIAEIENHFVSGWIEEIRKEFAYIASAENALVKDYACTLLAAIISDNQSAFLQIGDGGIVVGNEDEADTFCWIFWPQKGDYANMTHFITDADFAEHLQFDKINRQMNQISLFTDGLERLALNHSEQEVFNPFFKGFFQALNADSNCEKLNSALTNFLNSDRVNERTDDDKTLILASRKAKY